jgi:hypothetical protein
MRASLLLLGLTTGLVSADTAAPRMTVAAYTIHRVIAGGGTVSRTFVPSAVAPVSNAELTLSLTVKGSLVDLSTGADVVTDGGSAVSGASASITRRQGGNDTQIDIRVSGLQGKPPGIYRVRVRYAVETNGPDVVRIRLLARGDISAMTRAASPALLANTYATIGHIYTVTVAGTGLNVAAIGTTGMTLNVTSRSASALTFTVSFTQPGRYTISSDDFYDENLGHAPSNNEENEMRLRYTGNRGITFLAVGAPAVTAVSPQPASAFGSIALSGSNLSGQGLALKAIRYGHRYSDATESLTRAPTAAAHSTFAGNSGMASIAAAYDIASDPLELEFEPEQVVRGNLVTPPPSLVITVPFDANYSPSIAGVIASADQGTFSGVRVLRAGTATITGKYLFEPASNGGRRGKSPTFSLTTSASPPTVRLGALTFAVASMKHVPPSGTAPGIDSVRVTLPDPSDNVGGQMRVETGPGSSSVTSGMFVLATRPRVQLLTEITDTVPQERVVTNQTLFRGRQYQVAGTSMSVKHSSQLVQVGVVKLNGQPLAMQPTTDPNIQLRFLIPLTATTGTLTVASLGGETTLGTFLVTDPPPGSVPTPRPIALSVAPTSAPTGASVNGTVTLDNPGASVAGFTVALSSSDTSAVSVPATIPSPGTTASFAVTTKLVAAPRQVTITASSGGATQTRTITVTPPVPTGVTLSTSDVVSGTAVNGTIAFTGTATGVVATLGSSDAAAVVPASTTAAAQSATFSITTTEAPAPRTVTISANANGVAKTAALTITPFRIVNVTSSLDTIRVGQTATIAANVNRALPTNTPLTVAASPGALVQFDQSNLRLAGGTTAGTIGLRLMTAPPSPTMVTITISRSVVTTAFGTITTSATRNVVIAP